jgi:tetratricopeptide (TPR) repeat protein
MKLSSPLLLILLAAAVVVAAPAAPTIADPTDTPFSFPGKPWALMVNTRGFKLEQSKMRADGEGRYVFATNESTGVAFSVFIERAPAAGDSVACRQYYWSKELKAQPKKDDVKLSELGSLALAECTVKEFQGIKVNQRNVHAYLAKDDIWIDIHLSKTPFQPGDEHFFTDILKTVRIDESYRETSMSYVMYGSLMYRQENYRKAAAFYQTALDMEQRAPQLAKPLWYVLIDNLGIAYGINGDLQKAKATFEYGLSKDATYPLFYYNLACTYAEAKDLDNASANLKKAFTYKANILPGEHMPDPRTDSSFKNFLKDKRFQQALDELEK